MGVYKREERRAPYIGATAPPVGQDLLIIEASWSYSDTPGPIELLWTSDQHVAETSTWPTHNTHNRQTSMQPAGFELTTPATELPQTRALDRAASRIGNAFTARYDINL